MNQNELRDFYRSQADKIYRYFYFKTLDRELSEDMTSDAFFRFVDVLKNSPESIENYEAYLMGICKNIFIQMLRAKYKSLQQDGFAPDLEQIAAEEDDPDQESRLTLEERALPLIEKLPEKQRIIANLRFIEKLSLSDIATKIHKDMNYVKTTQKRALANLKKLAMCTP